MKGEGSDLEEGGRGEAVRREGRRGFGRRRGGSCREGRGGRGGREGGALEERGKNGKGGEVLTKPQTDQGASVVGAPVAVGGAVTLTMGPRISTSSSCSAGMCDREDNSCFSVRYFSSMLRRSPYLTGTDPSKRFTAHSRTQH